MIDKDDLNDILHFVSKRWVDMSRDPRNKAFENLPTKFWMNSMGGKAGIGRWITTLLYTEDEDEAELFKEILISWQSKHNNIEHKDHLDLIQIDKK